MLAQSAVLLPESPVRTGERVEGYIVARDEAAGPTCADGDMFEVTAWSENNRVHVTMESRRVLPTSVCGQSWRGSSGLQGSWVRSPDGKCRAGLCEGDLEWLATEGWVYVPSACYLRVYNRQAAWDCLAGKSLLWFGDSTLKQPATNLLENTLGVPVLRRSFNWMRQYCPQGSRVFHRSMNAKMKRWHRRGCGGAFSHRSWWTNRTNPDDETQELEGRMIWGGAADPTKGPRAGPTGLDLLYTSSDTRRQFYRAVTVYNHTDIFLHQYIWDVQAQQDHSTFEARVVDVVRGLLRNTTAGVHWDLPHPQCISDLLHDKLAMCKSAVENKLNSIGAYLNTQKLVARLEREFGNEPRFTMTDRYRMAQPHVMGRKYCQFGIHFGSHPAFCHASRPDNPPACYRDILVDKLEQTVWLNKMCSAAPPTTSSANYTMDAGVIVENVNGTEGTRPGWEVLEPNVTLPW